MKAYLSKDPLRIEGSGELLLYDDSFLHDADEPITHDEIIAINEYIGEKVLKPIRFYRKAPTRLVSACLVHEWIEKNEQNI
jgi:hypothetical protein